MSDENPFEEEPRTSLRRASMLPWVLVALALVAGGAYLWYRFGRSTPPPPPPPSAAPAPPMPAAPAPQPEAGTASLSDLLARVSSDPLWKKALALEDLMRRTAVVIDNLAEGVSPRRELAFLAPKGEFQVASRGGRKVIASASYARYDGFAAAVGSVDVPTVAAAYRAARPALQAAYKTLGEPAAGLDRALARALHRVANAPVRDGDVPLRDEGGIWVFEDAKLERLSAVDRHLLRMGPANTRIIQAKARALLEALALPEK